MKKKTLILAFILCIISLMPSFVMAEEESEDTVGVYFYFPTYDIYEIQKVKKGTPAQKPEDPNLEGIGIEQLGLDPKDFEFEGWVDELRNPWDFTTPVENNTMLFANFKNNTAMFEFSIPGEGRIKKKVSMNKPLPKPKDPVKEGHKFLGWFRSDPGNEGKEWDFEDLVSDENTLWVDPLLPNYQMLLNAKFKLVEEVDWKISSDNNKIESFYNQEKDDKYFKENKGVFTIPSNVRGLDENKHEVKETQVKTFKASILKNDYHTIKLGEDSILEELDLEGRIRRHPSAKVLFPKGLANKLKKLSNLEGRRLKGLDITEGVTPETIITSSSSYLEDPKSDLTGEYSNGYAKDISFMRLIYQNTGELFDGEEEKPLLSGSGKEYFLNPVKLKVTCKDKEGNILKNKKGEEEKYSIAGVNAYPIEKLEHGGNKNQIIVTYAQDDPYNPSEFNALEEKYRQDFKIIPEGYNYEFFGVEPDKEVTSSNLVDFKEVEVGRKLLLLLQQSDDFTLKPKAIEGYKAPEDQVIKLGKGQADFDPVKQGFKLNEDDLVWEKDIVLTYEKEAGKIQVDFSVDGNPYGKAQKVEAGQTITEPAKPNKEGFNFLGWYKGEEKWDFAQSVNEAMTLTAKFEKVAEPTPDQVQVYFVVDGNVELTSTIDKGQVVEKPQSDPESNGREFLGWYKGKEKWDFKTPVEEDLTLIAKFEEEKEPEPTTNKKPLQNLFDMVKDSKEKDYTPETWKPFEKVLNKAEWLLSSETASQNEVDTGKEELSKAYAALTFTTEKPEDRLKVEKVASVPTVEVLQGTTEKEAGKKLPEKLEITGSDGKKYNLSLSWKIYNYKKDKAGAYTAVGEYTLPESFGETNKDRVVKTTVVVKEKPSSKFKSFDKLDKIVVDQGQGVSLPSTVRVNYEDGTTRRLSVSWDKKVDTSKVGKVELLGSVDGIEEKAKLTVEVKAKKSGQSITLKDVRGHWGEKAILWTVKNGIFKGTDGNKFEPERGSTRGEFTAVLYRLSGEDDSKYKKNVFLDTGQGYFYDVPIEWARQKNLVNGYEDSKFHPERSITREEMASMMNRYINYRNYRFHGVTQKDFTDKHKISDWAKQDVDQLKVYGLVKGREGGMFVPEDKVKRAEVAQILYNMNERLIGSEGKSSSESTETSKDTKVKDSIVPQDAVKEEETKDPLPPKIEDGKEEEDVAKDKKKAYATVSVDILNLVGKMNLVSDESLRNTLPTNGWILSPSKIEIREGETVWDVTKRVASQSNIDLRYVYSQEYSSVYIQGINGLGEFDAGESSGWMYTVNGKAPNRGASIIKLRDKDRLEWRYTVERGDVAYDLTPLPDRQ